jgi:hypothetical protein
MDFSVCYLWQKGYVDCLCGPVVRVPGHRSTDSDPENYRIIRVSKVLRKFVLNCTRSVGTHPCMKCNCTGPEFLAESIASVIKAAQKMDAVGSPETLSTYQTV